MRTLLMLALAWCSTTLLADEPKNLLKPITTPESWRLEQHETATGEMEAGDEEVHFKVTAVDGTNWHVQVFQTDLDLEEGATYTLSYKAKSPDNRGYTIVAMIDEEDYHEIGLHEDLYAANMFREESFTFEATDIVAKKNRIGFVIGDEKGVLIIRDMTLTKKE